MDREEFKDKLKARWPIWHSVCKQVAFYYTENPKSGPNVPMHPRKARLLDGTTPRSTSMIRCGYCGSPVPVPTMRLEDPNHVD